jgi:hypothetical protein
MRVKDIESNLTSRNPPSPGFTSPASKFQRVLKNTPKCKKPLFEDIPDESVDTDADILEDISVVCSDLAIVDQPTRNVSTNIGDDSESDPFD